MNDKTYDPSTLEPKLAKFWLDIGYGKPSGKAEPYSIMVPPPNVTGTLHLGHGLQYAIMDTLVRQKRAQGYNVLLQAGTDHAGIATQMVVERQLAEKGIKRSDMDRESFIEKVWEWKGKSGQKMSKSRGNVLDPIDLIKGATLEQLIEKRTKGMMQPAMKEAAIKATKKSFPNGMDSYGTDALRFTFLQILTQAKDINFDLNKLRTSRNFCNKIWNAARFLSQHDEASAHTPAVIKEAFQHQIQGQYCRLQ